MENRQTLKAALWYSRKGWPLLPIWGCQNDQCECGNNKCSTPAKHPRIAGGIKNASTDQALIQTWWKKWPNSNIGVCTGKYSGFFALDVDPISGGDESLYELIAKYGKLPDTVETLTGNGGRHIFFEYPGYSIKGTVGFRPGLDIRGDGNYIVAPPSLHISGHRYEFEISSRPNEVAIASAPDWLLDLMQEESKKHVHSHDEGNPVEIIPEGKRDTTLTSIAGKFRRQGMEYAEILTALSALNQNRCQPPLVESQVEKITKSVSNYEPKFNLNYPPASENDENLNIIQLSTVKSEQVEQGESRIFNPWTHKNTPFQFRIIILRRGYLLYLF